MLGDPAARREEAPKWVALLLTQRVLRSKSTSSPRRRTRSHGEGLGQLLRSPGQAMSLAAALDPSANASGPGTLAAAIHRLSHAQTPGTSRFGTLPLPQRRGSTLAASHARNRSVGSAHLGLKRFASRGSMSDLAFAGERIGVASIDLVDPPNSLRLTHCDARTCAQGAQRCFRR